MLKQDYILRMIEQIIKSLHKLISKDLDPEEIQLVRTDDDLSKTLTQLINLLDEGRINEAEDQLFDFMDSSDKNCMALALEFYKHLNEFDDKYLESHDFSRVEVRDGLVSAARKYGYGSFVDTIISIE